MNKFSKRTLTLAAVALVLTAIYVIQLLAGLKSPQKIFKIKEEPESISIENSGSVILMQKNGDTWYSGTTQIDGAKMEYLLKDFTVVKTLGVASKSNSPAALERYGLDKPIRVRAKAGGKDLRAVFVGKESVSGSQCYIQFEGKNEIYLAQGNLRKDYTFTLDDIKQKPKEEEKETAPIEIHGDEESSDDGKEA